MRKGTRVAAIVTCLLLVPIAIIGIKWKPREPSANQSDSTRRGFTQLPEADRRPEVFEPFLSAHPQDEDHREAALVWYERRVKSEKDLKRHTFEMIKYHPGSMHIHFENHSLFWIDPDYRNRVIAALEDQLKRGHADHNLYWVLAMTCEQGALPIKFDDAAERQRFLDYFGLPGNVSLPSKLDNELAEKALGYYRLAIKTAEPESARLYVEQVVELLAKLDKPRESVDFAREMLKTNAGLMKDPGFLCEYGRSLMQVEDTKAAEKILGQVRACDREGFEGGPAHATTRAEMLLGELAMAGGNMQSAGAHLLAALDVQRCCHNSTQGISLELAKKLLDAGQYAVVAQFCERALTRFQPEERESKDLLTRAREKIGIKQSAVSTTTP